MCAVAAVAGGGAFLAAAADRGEVSNPLVASLPLALGSFALSTMVIVNTAWRVRESIYDLGAHAVPGAETKEIRIGQEAWTALGRVHVNYGGSEDAENGCVQCTDYLCGARRTCCGTGSVSGRRSRSSLGAGSAGSGGEAVGGEFGSGAGGDKVF